MSLFEPIRDTYEKIKREHCYECEFSEDTKFCDLECKYGIARTVLVEFEDEELKKDQKEAIERFSFLWQKYPQLRLGQFIVNVCNDTDILYYMSNEDLLKNIDVFYNHTYDELPMDKENDNGNECNCNNDCDKCPSTCIPFQNGFDRGLWFNKKRDEKGEQEHETDI